MVKNGGAGRDTLNGTSGKDTLRGRGGNDRLLGNGGDDLLVGGSGDDVIKGAAGLDDMGGGAGDDFLVAGFDGTDDRAYGGPGNDLCLDLPWGPGVRSAPATTRSSSSTRTATTFILCGAGDDTVIAEGRPPAGTVADDCEEVDVR